MKQIGYILILAIGGYLFCVGVALIPWMLSSNWSSVIPPIEGFGSMNLTTSAFDITDEKWTVYWDFILPTNYSIAGRCYVEVYDALTDEKLQKVGLPSGLRYSFREIKVKGSFYLKIQVYGEYGPIGPWEFKVEECKPREFSIWIAWIVVLGIASLVTFFGYKKLRHKRSSQLETVLMSTDLLHVKHLRRKLL